MTDPIDGPLADLADALGVATSYADWLDRRRPVSADTVRAVLAAMGVDASTDEVAGRALEAHRDERWRSPAPPTAVVAAGTRARVPLRVAAGADVRATLATEDGREVPLPAPPRARAERDVDGTPRGETALALPPDLPLGYHQLRLTDADGGGAPATTTLVVAPPRCPRWPGEAPLWGWMLQLYALRSRASWGLGDLGDLRDLAVTSGRDLGAGFLLCNPLHAASPVLPQQPSPYFPSSRRFTNPLYLRVQDVPEIAALEPDGRERLRALAARAADLLDGDRLDRDTAFRLKREALELLAAVERSSDRDDAFAAYRAREGQGLVDFATFCALAEAHGTPWQEWPAELRHPQGRAVAEARVALADRVDHHAWLQWLCDEQLSAAQRAATDAGMPVGVIHDLAVGVDPGGADAWALQDDLATGMTVGAPPDGFNQRGQDWALPPLLPNRLPDTGYAPYRDMMRSVLRHAGGLRIDHAMGLFRLWWIPEDRSAADGTYVRYPAADLLGILALEASRSDAVVVAEDLGTVEEGVTEAFEERGIFGSAVFWFERTEPDQEAERAEGDDDPGGEPLPAAAYRREAFASITTHDLPTAAGFWTGETVRVQTELGLYGEHTTPEREAERVAAEREELRGLLEREGHVAPDADVAALVDGMHAFIAETPSRLAAAAIGDALGDVRQPNMPGTTDEYPNWRLPVVEGEERRRFVLDDLAEHPRIRRTAARMAEGRRAAAERDARAAGSGWAADGDVERQP